MRDRETLKKTVIKYGLFAGMLVVFCVTRMWQLVRLPAGLHIDEAGLAYDAWCLAEYGVDRYLKSWPLYFVNKGDGSSVFGVYLCAGLFKIFGYDPWLLRFSAVLFSLVNLIYGIKIARKVSSESSGMPFVTGALIVICPYFIMAGRFTYDCNFMLGMSTLFLYNLLRAVESEKISRYVIAGISGGLVLYTYALSYMILPLFLILTLLYLFRVKKFYFKGWLAMAIPLGILAFPLILVQVVNLFDLEEFRLGIFTVTKLPNYRASDVGRVRWENILQCICTIFLGDLDPKYDLEYNTAPGFVNLYMVTVVFFAIGLGNVLKHFVCDIKKRQFAAFDMILLWFVGMLFFEFHIETNVNRVNGIFFVTILLAARGILVFLDAVRKRMRMWMWAIAIGCIYLCCFLRFAVYYYGGDYLEDTTYITPLFDTTVEDAVWFIEQDEVLRLKTTQMAEYKIYFALGTMLPPQILDFGDHEMDGKFQNYLFGTLSSIEDGCNYIVRDGFDVYCAELRAAGFEEQRFQGYSLYYKK